MTRSWKSTAPLIARDGFVEYGAQQPDPSESMVRVLVAESSEVLRLGLCLYLQSNPEFDLVGDISRQEDLIPAAVELQPDVLILDIHLTDVGGAETAKKIKKVSRGTQILIFGESEKVGDVRAALSVAARGYLLKTAGIEEVAHAIRQANSSQDYIAEKLAISLLASLGAAQSNGIELGECLSGAMLTPRERRVLSLVCTGLTSAEIGRELNLAEKTVKHHLTRIYRKLGVRNRAEAIHLANEQQFD